MCGIAGILDLNKQERVDQSILERMIQKISHRGPDQSAIYTHRNIGLAFARLSIIDLKGGMQPIMNEDETIISICNGEIYNYIELREELQKKGHVFRSQSDCEVIVHLYETYGYDFVTRLNGQFSFVIYDLQRLELFAVRDHFGIIPFFYTVQNGLFIFGSEVKAILEHPLVERAVDLIGLDQILSFPGLISPRTMFKNIKSLENGYYLVIKDGGLPQVYEYWDLHYPAANEIAYVHDERYYIERLDELLARSIKYRLHADVPVGLYISGGLDSALIASRAKMLEPTLRMRSFSIDFPDRELSEGKYQRVVSRHIDSFHHEYLFHSQEISRYLAQVIYHCESPLKETFDTAAFALSKNVHSKDIKVILTGQGADELFAGYIGYRFDHFKQSNSGRATPDSPRERQVRYQIWGDEQFLYEKNFDQFHRTRTSLYSPQVQEALDEENCFTTYVINKERINALDPLHRRSYVDYKLRLCNHLLADHGDRMAMAHSVECRYPFLDQELVNFVRFIPPSLKLKGLDEKYILKKVAAKYVPPAILKREKFGFAAPGSPHLLQQNNAHINDLLSFSRIQYEGYFNAQTVENLKKTYMQPGFQINVPFDDDLLIVVITFGLFLETFNMPALS
jgi:asparagine synthase (glutamine-hydrolysing)